MNMELTDKQKIEQLWGRLDKANQLQASTQLLVESAERQVEIRDEIIRKQKDTIDALTQEIKRMSAEVNEARQAAANAVREYIAAER